MILISDYKNELFYRQIMVGLCLKHGVGDIKSFGIGAWLISIIQDFSMSFWNRENSVHPTISMIFRAVACIVLGLIVTLPLIFSTIYILRYVNWLKRSVDVSGYERLFLSHDKSGAIKVKASKYMDETLCILHDSYSKRVDKDEVSMFLTFTLFERVFYLLVCFPALIVRDFLSCLFMLVFERKVAITDIFYLIDFALRIPHKCLYEISMSCLLKKNEFDQVITTNKEDRFAMLETRLCRGFQVPLICIPHGVEYEIDFPTGLAGDKFYCTSEKAKQALTALYEGRNNFIYDKDFQKRIYSRPLTFGGDRKIIFFTEPRVPQINLEICSFLQECKFEFYVKLHPSESKERYSKSLKGLQFEDNYDVALRQNICVARTSSVLVEALHNDSIPISIIVNDYDSYVVDNLLPSLRSSGVLRANSLQELSDLLRANDIGQSID